MLALSVPGGGPFAPDRWPLSGAFGAFTWTAWLVSGVFAVALGVAGATARGRARIRAWRGALGFVSLAAVAYGAAAAAQAGLIDRWPLAALGIALAALWVLRRLPPS